MSGFFMGHPQNGAGDLVPAELLYDAALIFGKQIDYKGGLDWDFSRVKSSRPSEDFEAYVYAYIDSVLRNRQFLKGWKLPENSLILPWLIKMFPRAYYIYWIRDPRDVILDLHITDNIRKWNVPAPMPQSLYNMRAISWYYQYELAHSIIKPKRWLEVRFEDFVLHQEREVERIGDFLHMKMVQIPVQKDKVGAWRRAEDVMLHNEFLQEPLEAYYKDMI
jgi:hypothetical protein